VNDGAHFTPSRGNLSRWAIEHPALVRFFIVLILLVGARSYFELGQAEDPPFTFKTMLIQAQWPGATTQEVSEQLTERIEKKLQDRFRCACRARIPKSSACAKASSSWAGAACGWAISPR
jgi:hypothetical protein